MKTIFFTLILVCASVGFSKATPNAYSKQVKEINLILKNKAFIEKFNLTGSNTISNVSALGSSTYEITVAECVGVVKVEENALPVLNGPISMAVVLGEVSCLPGGFSVGNQ